jgi:hypothetical protein
MYFVIAHSNYLNAGPVSNIPGRPRRFGVNHDCSLKSVKSFEKILLRDSLRSDCYEGFTLLNIFILCTIFSYPTWPPPHFKQDQTCCYWH